MSPPSPAGEMAGTVSRRMEPSGAMCRRSPVRSVTKSERSGSCAMSHGTERFSASTRISAGLATVLTGTVLAVGAKADWYQIKPLMIKITMMRLMMSKIFFMRHSVLEV